MIIVILSIRTDGFVTRKYVLSFAAKSSIIILRLSPAGKEMNF